jgi:DNA polymerase-1
MDESSLQRHINAMMDAEIIGVDTESTGLKVKDGRDYGTGISVAYRLGPLGIISAYFPFRHSDGNLDRTWLDKLATVFDNKPIVFHNLKHDLHTLATWGIHPKSKTYCTMNIEHMLNEELLSKKLDYLSKKYFNEGKDRDEVAAWTKAFGWGSVPASLMEQYACKDAELALRHFERQWPKMVEEELHTLWPTERRWCKLLFDMEQRGVRVDTEFAKQKAFRGRDRMTAVLDELDVEEDKLGPKVLTRILFDDLGLPIHHVSEKTGKPSFNKEAMEYYDDILSGQAWDSNPTAKLVLEYRGWQKAVTSLYEPIIELVSPDGRIRPNYKQHGTRTGRLSCEGPNLQQIPRKSAKVWNGDAKQAFVARDGYELVGYDYSQLEFRLAAAYGREQWLLDEFANPNGDVFTAMADKIGVDRFIVKTYTYATIYGAGLTKIAATLGKKPHEIEDTYNAFKESISGIRYTSEIATRRAKERGYVKYWTGRRRHFPYRDGHHKAFNSLLQGGGAELVKHAMIAIDDNVCDKDCQIVMQVHDEIVFEMREGMRKNYEDQIIKHMTNFPDFGVTLAVAGKNWTTGEEFGES